jgi:hypothetical protein
MLREDPGVNGAILEIGPGMLQFEPVLILGMAATPEMVG